MIYVIEKSGVMPIYGRMVIGTPIHKYGMIPGDLNEFRT